MAAPPSSAPGSSFGRRFAFHVSRRRLFRDGDTVVVAVSGGLDSAVLLHLLRFGADLPALRLHAAHLDHRMRPGSGGDARWVTGLCRAWEVPCTVEAAPEIPQDEGEARDARYRFFARVRTEAEADWVATAHHADDQAETILFRVLRGTGLRGLEGIPERRSPGIVRPLLPFWRHEIAAHAVRIRLSPRIDPSNLDPRFARNVLRHELLPRAEAVVAPGARASLVRLGRHARRWREAWTSLVPGLLAPLVVEGSEDRVVLDRSGLLAYHSAVVAEVLQELARRFGTRLDEAGTRAAQEFTRTGLSGRRIRLSGGIELAREFDWLVVARPGPAIADRPLVIEGPGAGRGTCRVGRRLVEAEWSVGEGPSGGHIERFSLSELRFPLVVRGREPGDRVRLRYGSKTVAKLMAEARIPVSERASRPVVADADGRILWVPEFARSVLALPQETEEVLAIGIRELDEA